jgi:hemerythrin-like domain-containing protein
VFPEGDPFFCPDHHPAERERLTVAETENVSQRIERYQRVRKTLQPVDLLVAEHRIIQAVLDAMETESARLSAGRPLRHEFWHRVADFVENFADRCHHHNAEDVLFSHMLGRARSERVGAIVSMKHEHVEGRALKDCLCIAANGSDASALRKAAGTYSLLLRQHMAAEEHGLFVTARALASRRAERMRREFRRVEQETLGAGGYDRYLDLAKEICREAEEAPA